MMMGDGSLNWVQIFCLHMRTWKWEHCISCEHWLNTKSNGRGSIGFVVFCAHSTYLTLTTLPHWIISGLLSLGRLTNLKHQPTLKHALFFLAIYTQIIYLVNRRGVFSLKLSYYFIPIYIPCLLFLSTYLLFIHTHYICSL